MRILPISFAFSLLSSVALAQSSPGWTAGQVPTAAQWNAQWAGKADSAAPVIAGPASIGTDWLSGYTAAGLPWPAVAAQTRSLSTSGKIGLSGASRASDLSSSYGSLETTIGVAAIAVNDDAFATSARHVTVYGGYDEAETLPGAYGLSFGREIDASNLSGLAPALSTPGAPLSDGTSTVASGTTAGLWIASGGGHASAGDASFALGIKDNGAHFQTGILFGADALTDYGGFSYAMRLPKGAVLQWHDAADVAGPSIASTVASAANAMSLQFQDGGALFLNPGTATVGFEVQSQIGAVNGLNVQPVVAGASPQIMAAGSDANVGINLIPKGTGAVYTPGLLSAGSLTASGATSLGGTLWVAGATTLAVPLATPGLIATGTAPTLSGTCATGTKVGGNAAGSFKFSSACAAGTVVLTFASAAPNGWACHAQDMTTPADTLKQTAFTPTSATFAATAASGDQAVFQCSGF